MTDPTPDSDAPPTDPAWGGAALAAGAAVLAGLVLGRAGKVGIAAGVAAAAGMKLMSEQRKNEAPIDEPYFVPLSEVTVHTNEPGGDSRDWVDMDAVFFDHMVPDTKTAGEFFKEKSLPLLDDDGLPVEHVAVHPAYPEEEVHDFPLGPIIWEPGRHVQSSSDGAGDTVWFSLQDVAHVDGAQPLPAPGVGTAAVAPFVVEQQENLLMVAPDDGAIEMPQASSPMASEEPATEGHHGRASAFVVIDDDPHEGVAPQSTGDETTVAAVNPISTPMLQLWKPPSVETPEPLIVPRRAEKTMLPQPRRPGEPPRQIAGAAPVLSTENGRPHPPHGDNKHALLSRLLPAQGPARTGTHRQSHHHLEPVAPVTYGAQPKRRPLVMTLFLLLIVGLFVAAGWWRDGELLRKLGDIPWLQTPQTAGRSAPHPAVAAPASEGAPRTAGRWMNAPDAP